VRRPAVRSRRRSLADSTPAVARVWTIFANKHGFDAQETVRRAHGRPSIATIESCCQTRTTTRKCSARANGIEDIADVVALPGAGRAIATRYRRISGQLWTSCTRALALVRLRAAGLPPPRTDGDFERHRKWKAQPGTIFERRRTAWSGCC